MSELSPSGGSEGYGARDDEGAHAAQDAETFVQSDHFRFIGGAAHKMIAAVQMGGSPAGGTGIRRISPPPGGE